MYNIGCTCHLPEKLILIDDYYNKKEGITAKFRLSTSSQIRKKLM